ncbi:hypothetical protein BBK82_20780 [Lentzea guizhouensis]|uniref:DUF2269 domain-containing protein n=1 Tax=Lentzea guizhouensis TaxID=1586287 RepID=A0A1B2HYX3_9PSEU|nr:hypothetical protein [Lentzea guizhouensis]ANZ42904.1 hypothetical protein BBK82_20780 [Lentzea guizhouensis]
MSKLFLSLHVLAAIIAIGPVTVAASMFPKAVATDGNAALLHRICRVYALLGISVPVFGFATAGVMGVTGHPWVVVSIALTTAAAFVLALKILPGQEQALKTGNVKRLAMYTGVFNLLWAVVTVLMILRPGSTTGA